MNKGKVTKIILSAIAVIILTWVIISAVWFIKRDRFYGRYSQDMEESAFSTWLTPSYVKNVDGVTYAVKYPGYLSSVGNLSVAPEEGSDVAGLIIWPLSDSEYEYGVILNDGGEQHQIYVDGAGRALISSDEEILSRYADQISDIMEKANTMWALNRR